MSVTSIRGDFTSLSTIMDAVKRDHPDAVNGIVVVWDRDGGMTTYHHCTGEEKAYAAARLLKLATRD